MENDAILGILLILLGAQISYVADEVLGFTPRLASWLGDLFQ